MTPESIPGTLVPHGLDLFRPLVHPHDLADPVHHGPAYQHHEPFLTNLPEAA